MSDKNYKETLAQIMRDPSPAQREALAQILVEFIQPNHLTNEIMSLLLNTRSLTAGDVLVKKIRKGIEVRTLVPGAVHLASEITISDRINFVLEGADTKVTYNAWELERGEIGTVDSISSEMRAVLQDYFVNRVFTLLSTIWSPSNTPSNYGTVTAANWAAGNSTAMAAMKTAIDAVNNLGMGAKVVIGAREVIAPTTQFTAFWGDPASTTAYETTDSQLQQVFDSGRVGRWYGVPFVAIDQIWDNPEDFKKLIPTDKVLVIGNKVGDFITYGDVKTKQWTDMAPTPPQWYLELYQQFGLIIDNAMGIYVLKIT
jgi:hypothetical protein